MKKLKLEFLTIVVILGATLFPVLLWHAHTSDYPTDSHAIYLWRALAGAHAFTKGSWWTGLQDLFLYRIWKPILHPALATPFFLLMKKSGILQVQAAVAAAFYGITAIGVYVFSRRFLSQFDAVLTTLFVLLQSWMLESTQLFSTEVTCTAFFVWSWVFLLRSERFTKPFASFAGAVLAAVALCIRPVEVGLIYFLSFAVSSAVIGDRRELWGSVAMAVPLSLLSLVHMGRWKTDPWAPDFQMFRIVLGGFAVTWLGYWRWIRPRTRSFLPAAVLVATGLSLIWFSPFLGALSRWILSCSYEAGTVLLTQQRTGFAWLARTVFPHFFLGFSGAVFLAGLIWIFVFRESLPEGSIKTSLRWVIAVILLSLGVHLTLGIVSYNPDPRYYEDEFAILYWSVAVVFLRTGRWSHAKRALVLLAILIAGTNAIREALNDRRPDATLSEHVELFEKIRPMVAPIVAESPGGMASVLIAPTNSSSIALMNPGRLELVSLERGFLICFTIGEISSDRIVKLSNLDDWLVKSGPGYQAVIIGPMETAPGIESLLRQKNPPGLIEFSVKGTAGVPHRMFWFKRIARDSERTMSER